MASKIGRVLKKMSVKKCLKKFKLDPFLGTFGKELFSPTESQKNPAKSIKQMHKRQRKCPIPIFNIKLSVSITTILQFVYKGLI